MDLLSENSWEVTTSVLPEQTPHSKTELPQAIRDVHLPYWDRLSITVLNYPVSPRLLLPSGSYILLNIGSSIF